MKRLHLSFVLLAFIAFVGCKNDKKNTDENTETETEMTETETVTTDNYTEPVRKLKVTLNPKSGSNVKGTAVFKEEDGIVTFTAVMSGLEPGEHAIHLHETADCSSEDGKSTGGHWNPTGEPHGKWGDAAGYHKGDIGNFHADDKGNGTITFSTDLWCIGCGDPAKDILGKAIIVHQGADDFTSQPSGAAGARVSCAGVIE